MRPAIQLVGVSKRYRRQTDRHATSLKTYLVRDLWRRRAEPVEYTWALRDVDLEVAKGTTVAIVGRNGSGKSTLLLVIGGMLGATTGTVRVDGRSAALIELAAGFHPELTGRENVLINGVLLGLSRGEIRRRFDDIVRFAELEAFIDQPVRTYSTGMYMRLGFSVAVHVDPDVLLFDEVLAVGDLSFVHKCLDRMNAFKRAGKTIVVVTHDLNTAATWADRAVWMDRGRLRMAGAPPAVVDAYMKEAADPAGAGEGATRGSEVP